MNAGLLWSASASRQPKGPTVFSEFARAPRPEGCLRVVSWNCQMALDRKADRLLALSPDIAVVPECSDKARLDGLDRVGWTGVNAIKGLAVFARPDLGAVVDECLDATREWYLPIALPSLGLNVLAAWSMHHRGGEAGPQRGRIHRTLEHYAGFLAGGRTMLIGDLNDNITWDTPAYPSFARVTSVLEDLGLTNLYVARSGEAVGAETFPTLFFLRHLDKPYFVDHAFVPRAWLPRVRAFEIGRPDDWLAVSDHMPLVLDLEV